MENETKSKPKETTSPLFSKGETLKLSRYKGRYLNNMTKEQLIQAVSDLAQKK